MIFKTKEDLEKRLTYLWDYADKNSDIKALLNELWNDIVETRNVTELNERNSVDEGEKSCEHNWESLTHGRYCRKCKKIEGYGNAIT